jgi:hypothetical protein
VATVKSETEAAAALVFQKKVAAVEEQLSEQETKVRLKERTLARLLKEIEDASPELFAKLSKTALEYTTEKPAQVQKRISEHTETHQIGGETLERLEKMLKGDGYLRPALNPAPEAIEAVVISD